MIPDPDEIEALEKAYHAFTAAHEELIYRLNKIRNIHCMMEEPKVNHDDGNGSGGLKEAYVRTGPSRGARPGGAPGGVREAPPQKEAPSGKFCDRCHSTKMINKGGGCMRCADCGYDAGCNG